MAVSCCIAERRPTSGVVEKSPFEKHRQFPDISGSLDLLRLEIHALSEVQVDANVLQRESNDLQREANKVICDALGRFRNDVSEALGNPYSVGSKQSGDTAGFTAALSLASTDKALDKDKLVKKIINKDVIPTTSLATKIDGSPGSPSSRPPCPPDLPNGETLRSTQTSVLDYPVFKVIASSLYYYQVGFSGSKKLLGYNFDNLQSYAAIPAILSMCSIFRLRSCLLKQLLIQPFIVTLIYLALKPPFSTTVSADSGAVNPMEGVPEEETDDTGRRLESTGALIRDVDPVVQLTNKLNGLVPFLLGLFIATQLRRWWSIRSVMVQRIFRSSTRMSIFLGLVIPDSAESIRLRVERYLLAAHKLMYLCVRAQDERLCPHKHERNQMSCMDTMIKDSLLTPEEVAMFRVAILDLPEGARKPLGVYDLDIAGVPVIWAAQLIYRLFQYGNQNKEFALPVPVMLKMVGFCLDVKQGLEDVEMMLTSPLPFPYVHLVSLLVHFLAFFSCLRLGLILGTLDHTPSPTRLFCEMLYLLVMNAIYSGLLCFTVVLTNPFSDDVIDFPAAMFHHRLWKLARYARCAKPSDHVVDAQIAADMEEMRRLREKHKQVDPDDHEEEEDEDDEAGDADADDADDCE